MNSQHFLLLNIAILFFFVVWFLAGRRRTQKDPTQLQMKRGNDNASAAQGRYSHPRFQKYLQEDGFVAAEGKQLNILFNYNGHTWDAYEVLGVPAGAGLVEVTKAYQEMLKSAEPESHEFLETAFKTILSKK